MRLIRLVPAALILCVAAPAFGQEWIEYYSRSDAFLVNFPKQPQVRDIAYPTEFGLTLTGHLHVDEEGTSRFSVTVIDYSDIVKLHAERVKGCTAYPDQCTNQGANELRGALEYAVWNFLKRDAKVTYFGYANSDRIEGRRVQLTNPDKSKTFASIYMHENRLIILEATVPKGYPPPTIFQQSLGWLDEKGVRGRYQFIYYNEPDVPKPLMRGR